MSTDRTAILRSMPADGHVAPMLAVGRGLARPRVAGPLPDRAAYADRVRAAGFAFTALPPEAVTLDEVAAGERPKGVAAINDGVTGAVLDPAPHAARTLLAMLDEEPADACSTADVRGRGRAGGTAESNRPLRVMRHRPARALEPRDPAVRTGGAADGRARSARCATP